MHGLSERKIPRLWLRAFESTTPLPSLSKLPAYGAVFFIKNMGRFKLPFFLLTIVSVSGALLGFALVYLVSNLIDHAKEVTTDRLLYGYVPLFMGIIIVKETLEYFIRKYGEAFSTVYSDHLQLRFLLSLLRLRFSALTNVQPQRLLVLISRYIANVRFFIDDWFWGLSRKITQLFITLAILYAQSPLVLGVNIIYFSVFLYLALRISAKLSPLAERYAAEDIQAATVVGSFSNHLPAVRRLGIEEFFSKTFQNSMLDKWSRFSAVREFHARRWFLQLILYECGYVGTLGFGVYQVATGALSLGFLVLIKYAFDTLSQILIHVIEYYVSLIQQREDSAIIRKEFAALETTQDSLQTVKLDNWKTLELSGASCTFQPSSVDGGPVAISIPKLIIRRGEKAGIIGPSGAGKSSLLSMLLNLIEFDGEFTLDGCSIKGIPLSSADVCIVNNTDPLFALSLRDNLLLGRDFSEDKIRDTLRLVEAQEFTGNLEARVGDSDFNLSSGQQQRIRLARALFSNAELYLLDEPFNGIDEQTKGKILSNLKTFFAEKTVLLVTHNEKELELVGRVYSMKSGRLEP